MKLKIALATLFCTALVAGCATKKAPQDPYMGRDEFYRSVQTIAIAPLTLPPDVSDQAPVAAKFEALIADKLRAGGYAVVPAKDFTAVFEKVKSTQGSYFNVITGKYDEAKYRAILEQTRQQFSAQRHIEVNAVLYPHMEAVRAEWHDDTANWDGNSEPVAPDGRSGEKKSFLSVLAPGRHGTVAAYTLTLAIQDMHGNTIYAGKGGVQLLQKLFGHTVTSVSRAELFANNERNRTAVQLALGRITARLATTPVVQSTLASRTASARN